MTELFIDGVSVILPDDFSTTVKRENPFFTKNGEYTYDITLKLTNPVNAQLYEHLNRLNSVSEIKGKRSAVLIADNRVYCNGTEIITGWTENDVKIQLASGNSELNYFIGSDLKISFLKMPETTPMKDRVPDQKYIRKLYPEIDFCLSPIINRTSGVTINEWIHNRVGTQSELRHKFQFSGFDYIPQPFLCAYIREVLKAIGYSMTSNALEDTDWKDLCICHVIATYKWAEMLPGWTVKEFFEEIENLFNVSFVIDSRKRTVKVLANNTYYTQSSIVHIQNVVDAYELEIEEEPENDNLHSTISYDFPDNSYFRHRCLPDSVSKNAKRGVIHKDLSLDTWFREHKDKNVIYTWENDGREYVYNSDRYVMGVPFPKWDIVNEFKKLERDDPEKELKLNMMPVELTDWPLYLYQDGVKVTGTYTPYILPVVEGSTDNQELEFDETLEDMINNASDKGSETKEPIFLVFHRGLNNKLVSVGGFNTYPMPFTDDYLGDSFGYTEKATLRLQRLNEFFYNNSYDIDRQKCTKIVSYDPNVIDPRSILEINNKRYVCKETEYIITTSGRNKSWTGLFYPIKISDIEADQRWILADGKWRDGGVWLDNGRWIDE